MVASTPTLQSLKPRFFPKLHQSMPLTARESQRLLDSITVSFRKNLDKEHPWQSAEAAAKPGSRGRNATTTTSPGPLPRHRPTDQHLRAILSNPLFAAPRDTQAAKPPPGAPPGSGMIPGLAAARDPVEIFDAASAKGLMNLARAAGFLAAVRQGVVYSESRVKLGGTGAGLRVVQWLRASGHERRLDFLSHGPLVQRLVPFMYAEGLEEIAWMWLGRLASAEFAHLEVDAGRSAVAKQPLFGLLTAMIHTTSHPISVADVCLDGSFASLARADDLLRATAAAGSSSSNSNRVAKLSLRNAWSALSWASTVEALRRPAPSAPLFEAFVDRGRPYGYAMDLAHLELHHPTAPSPDAAVRYMGEGGGALLAEAAPFKPAEAGSRSVRRQRRLVCLALDAARQLKAAGDTAEASWVETLISRMYDKLDLNILVAPHAAQGHPAGSR